MVERMFSPDFACRDKVICHFISALDALKEAFLEVGFMKYVNHGKECQLGIRRMSKHANAGKSDKIRYYTYIYVHIS